MPDLQEPLYPCGRLFHPRLDAAGGASSHWDLGPDAAGLPEGIPPGFIFQYGSARDPLDAPDRPERAGPSSAWKPSSTR